MTVTSEQAYMAAVALNNTGVELLGSHFYDEAIDLFNTAVVIMRNLVSPEERPASLPFSLSNIHETIRQANMKLRQEVPRLGENSPLKFMIVTEETASSAVETILQREEHEGCLMLSTTVPLVRMELQSKCIRDIFADDSQSSLNFESSIILYNYGNACKSLAFFSASADGAQQNYQGAYQLSELSQSLLLRQKESPEAHDELLSIPISILILRSITVVATILRLEESHQRYFLSLFLEMKEAFQDLFVAFSGSRNIAAAAA